MLHYSIKQLSVAAIIGVTAISAIVHQYACAQSPPVTGVDEESKLVAALEAAGAEEIRVNSAGLVEAVKFKGDQVPANAFDLLPQLKGLIELRIVGDVDDIDGEVPSSANDDTVAKLSGLNNLRILDLRGSTNLTDEGLAHLATLEGLNELVLTRVSATDVGLVHLASMSKLVKLTLGGRAIAGEGLGHLDKLTGLQRLVLGYGPIKDDALRHLGLFPKLQTLHVGFSSIGDTGLAHIGQVTSLRQLDLSLCDNVSNKGLSHLIALKNLERVNLSRMGRISDHGLAHVGKITSLKQLYLSGTPIGDPGIKHLQNLNALEELRIDSTKVTDAGLTYLPSNLRTLHLPRGVQSFEHLGHLTSLEVLGAQVTGDPGIKHLKSDKLRVLGLGYWDVPDSDLPQFERFTRLESVYFGSDRITDAGLPPLVTLKNLEFLNLEDATISDAGLLQLASLNRLSRLVLNDNPSVTELGVNRLRELLPDCKIDYWRRQE
jgi:Leucine-rich repeat (LRR) protein